MSDSQRNTLNIFLSYSRRDEKLVDAIRKCISTASDLSVLRILQDKSTFSEGEDLNGQITSFLDQTDILVPIYATEAGSNFGFTGYEMGYFEGIKKSQPHWDFVGRQIKPISLSGLAPTAANRLHISLGITPDLLTLEWPDFQQQLRLGPTNPMVKFLTVLETYTNQIKSRLNLIYDPTPQNKLPFVQAMYEEIFSYLKEMEEEILKPQMQIVIRTSDRALEHADGDLPPDAVLVPNDTGAPLSIFGLPNREITWQNFCRLTGARPDSEWWRDAITSVVLSSQYHQIDVDNSQVVLAADGRSIYRLILTTSRKFYNGRREFNVYFVEALRRPTYGDRRTTLLLKGLELVCRARFLFLERGSEFTEGAILTMEAREVPEVAKKLVTELNLMRRDAREFDLHKPAVWAEFTDWQQVQEMHAAWGPAEQRLRDLAALARTARGDAAELATLQGQIATALKETQAAIRPHNLTLLQRMTGDLGSTLSAP